jgi:hypothetical protein
MPEFLAMAVDSYRLWRDGKVLRVKFLGGTERIQKLVEKFAKEWENYASIRFYFVRDGYAHIRVSFDQKIGSQSLVGNAAIQYPAVFTPSLKRGGEGIVWLASGRLLDR